MEKDLSEESSVVFVGGLTIIVYNKVGSILAALVFVVAVGALCGLLNGVLVRKRSK